MRRLLYLLVLGLLLPGAGRAAAQERGAAALGKQVEGLDVAARVLVIAAHPDDEDTQLIAWLARGQHVETAYLSLTRGDGGQNLIGNELGEALGAIRAEELLAARRIDGGRQYFARAYDFGFSKSAEETFRHWPREELVRDVVTVVRAFRPHVIVSIFSGTPRDGHGHHQAAGIVAREAYDAAGDVRRFPPAATAGLPPWTPLKFYRSARFDRDAATLAINVGAYDPLLGRSYAEIAGESRSQHRSQGFGALQPKGPRFTYLQREHSRAAAAPEARQERSPLDGGPATLAAFREAAAAAGVGATLDSLLTAIDESRRTLDLRAPERSVEPLARVARLAHRAAAQPACAADPRGGRCAPAVLDLIHSLQLVAGRAERALLEAAGLAVEVTAERETVAAGDSLPVTVSVYNRGRVPVEVLRAQVRAGSAPNAGMSAAPAVALLPDSVFRWTGTLRAGSEVSMPGWLEAPRRGELFAAGCGERCDAAAWWPLLEGGARVRGVGRVELRIAGADVAVHAPVERVFADPVRGEVRRELAVVPPVAVTLERNVAYTPADAALDRVLRVHLSSAATAAREVRVTLRLPAGLGAEPAAHTLTLEPGETRTAEFRLRGRLRAGAHEIAAVAESGGERFARGYVTVDYEHIRPQRLYRDATLRLQAVDVRLPAGAHVAYVPGVGDPVAPTLEQLGIPLSVLEPERLRDADLSRFSAVVIGPRAYGAHAELVAHNARLLDYVRAGGTLVVQYGQYEMTRPGIMPFPITIRRPHTRVTDPAAPVRILHPDHPLLTTPNRITEADFAGWVQERALYMPATFDAAYTPLLAMSDPGEEPNEGALLVARYGRGSYVYTSLAFFRQLPAGVPGAARLFVNLLAAAAND